MHTKYLMQPKSRREDIWAVHVYLVMISIQSLLIMGHCDFSFSENNDQKKPEDFDVLNYMPFVMGVIVWLRGRVILHCQCFM